MMSPSVLEKSGYARAGEAALGIHLRQGSGEQVGIKMGPSTCCWKSRSAGNDPVYRLDVVIAGEAYYARPVGCPRPGPLNLLAAFVPSGTSRSASRRVGNSAGLDLKQMMGSRLPEGTGDGRDRVQPGRRWTRRANSRALVQGSVALAEVAAGGEARRAAQPLRGDTEAAAQGVLRRRAAGFRVCGRPLPKGPGISAGQGFGRQLYGRRGETMARRPSF